MSSKGVSNPDFEDYRIIHDQFYAAGTFPAEGTIRIPVNTEFRAIESVMCMLKSGTVGEVFINGKVVGSFPHPVSVAGQVCNVTLSPGAISDYSLLIFVKKKGPLS